MWNKKSKKYLLLIFIVGIYLISTEPISAQISLKLTNSPPCLLKNIFGECYDPTTLEGYINLIYRFALGVGGFLALGMIIWGGILISISGSIDKTKEGRSYITSALLGLAMLFGSYLILKTINPSLTYLSPPSVETVSLPQGDFSGGGGIKPGSRNCNDIEFAQYCMADGQFCKRTKEAEEAENKARNSTFAGITIVSKSGNNDLCRPDSTSVGYLPESVANFLRDVESKCGIKPTLTGGNEIGHKTHCPGKPIFDISARDEETAKKIAECFVNKDILTRHNVTYINISPNMNYSLIGDGFCNRINQKGITCSQTEPNERPHFHIKIGLESCRN